MAMESVTIKYYIHSDKVKWCHMVNSQITMSGLVTYWKHWYNTISELYDSVNRHVVLKLKYDINVPLQILVSQ